MRDPRPEGLDRNDLGRIQLLLEIASRVDERVEVDLELIHVLLDRVEVLRELVVLRQRGRLERHERDDRVDQPGGEGRGDDLFEVLEEDLFGFHGYLSSSLGFGFLFGGGVS